MTHLSESELEAIIRRDLPGFRLADREAESEGPCSYPPDQISPEISDLRRRYFGEALEVTSSEADDEIVTVQSSGRNGNLQRVVLSGEEHRIVGAQG